jgi:serine/threonine-protein kinase RsbW
MLDAGDSLSSSFPAVAESVPRARAALTDFALAAGAAGERLDAIRLAASEAVSNAVMHAYSRSAAEDSSRNIHVNASFVEDDVWVLVSDEGGGLRPHTQSTGLGLGLVLIAQLADEFQILSRGGGGTELRMRFQVRAAKRSARRQPRGSVASASAAA